MITAAETTFNEAAQTLKNARRAWDRSRSKKNGVALVAAREAFEVAGAAFRAEQDAERRVYRLEIIGAWLAAKRAKAALQGALFSFT